jgi:O-antigen ligase
VTSRIADPGRRLSVWSIVDASRLLHLALAVGLLIGAVAAAAAVALMGYWALAVPAYVGAAAAIVLWPRQSALGLLVVVMALEPQTVDVTKYIAALVYDVPPGFHDFLPFTIAPFEMALVLLLGSLYLRQREHSASVNLPIVVYLVPIVCAFAVLYGIRYGAPYNLAYHEARGFIYGSIAFMIAIRIAPTRWDVLSRWVMVGAGTLAIITLYRYFFHIRTGDFQVAIEFAFAHESPIFLCTGLVIAGLLAMRNGKSSSQRMALFAYCLMVLVALAVTQRRAATAVLLVAALWTGFMLFPRRPVLVVVIAIPLLFAGSLYLAAYWDKEYGAAAQPARAIRSQIDPSPRDESSDVYRETERYNVMETIRATPVFGLGFGRQFFLYQPLPDLTGFWPLQFYTPHQNVLWLWLKLGFGGITVVLTVAAIAVSRCIRVTRLLHWSQPQFLAGVVLSSVILMYLIFGTIDLAFTGTRPMAPLTAAIAGAFILGAANGVGMSAQSARRAEVAARSPRGVGR